MTVKTADFELLPDDLVAPAVKYAGWLEGQGLRLVVEPTDLEYPNTPVFKGTQGKQADWFIEVSSKVNIERAQDWATYGKASSHDTRYIVAISGSKAIPPGHLASLSDLGVGLDVISDSGVSRLCHPKDLSMSVDFPSLPRKLAPLLSNAKSLLSQGNWREAYEDACVALETAAREYLKRGLRAGRLTFVSAAGKTITHTEATVDRLTLGQTGQAFSNIYGPSQDESRVAQGILRINPRRKTVAHFKHQSGKRAQELRAEVGRDFIIIVNCMKLVT